MSRWSEMSEAEQRDMMLRASYAIATVDARRLLLDCELQIKKRGGERQRSEGVKLLRRIAQHIFNTAMDPLRELDEQNGLDNKKI